ncbi:cytochrome P450 2J6-like [Mizuhopecten yessoensis]|uniref:Cytochrome P450 2J2 n=1 Tax=Mizuhopecten yessoensis TaxID=6573 RepID=A0A210QD47_MIZYE|nr:cytochrome P450 2J6-like [Mizuhopecten yessoensis]OWF46611.1 Cytochrome P450 2J2 [Mizuhopecten yessoensis]
MLQALLSVDPLTVALGTLGLLFLLKLIYVPSNSPPGPTGYPLVGNFPLVLSGKRSDTFRKLQRKYGEVFRLQLGSRRMVVISGYNALREAFVKHGDVFSERPEDYVFKRFSNYKGIVASSGEYWKHTRTFSFAALKKLGFANRSLESKIMEEVSVFLEIIREKKGEAFSIQPTAHLSVSNIMCSMTFGKRFQHDDKEFNELMKMTNRHIALIEKSAISNFFPILRYLPGDLTHIEELCSNVGNIKSFLQLQIEQHRATFDGENIRDFIDAFLKEQNDKGTSGIFDDENLMILTLNLFNAGTATIAVTISWAILFLIHHPDVQTKLRQEIEDVIGFSRPPALADRAEMTYTDAFIHETSRMGNISPFSLLHGVKHDTTFKGYKIFKDDLVLPNLDSVMFDETLFEDPNSFNPERFIGKDGKLNGKERAVLAFSLGKRMCMGESVAKMELFLFLTSLVQKFKLLPENDEKLPSLESNPGIIYFPNDFKFKSVEVK